MEQPARPQDSATKQFCFTKFNYLPADLAGIIPVADCSYLIQGEETCPETGTPHLQCFVIFKNRVRITALIRKYPGLSNWEAIKGNVRLPLRENQNWFEYYEGPSN